MLTNGLGRCPRAAAGDGAGYDLAATVAEGIATVPANLAAALGSWLDPLGLDIGHVSDQATAAEAQAVDAGTFGATAQCFDGQAGAFAYYAARRHAGVPMFTFGPGKSATLGGYTGAVALALVALLLAVESVGRLIEPQAEHFREAMMVAWVGLAVNLASAWLLGHGGPQTRFSRAGSSATTPAGVSSTSSSR